MIVRPSNTVILLCDMQERFRTKISHFKHVENMAEKMLKVAAKLDVPILSTEQNPKALGPTVESLAKYLPSVHATQESGAGAKIYPKTQFSMLIPEIRDALPRESSTRFTHVALLGIETHICVWQTCLDLLHDGFRVHVVADAVSSCNVQERALALQVMSHRVFHAGFDTRTNVLPAQSIRDAGGMITTTESLIYRLLADANHPRAKEVFAIVKEYSSSTKDALNALCSV